MQIRLCSNGAGVAGVYDETESTLLQVVGKSPEIDQIEVDIVALPQMFHFGALYPSKTGLMNKHIVKHSNFLRRECREALWVLRGRCFIFGALYPFPSGLIQT